MRRVVDFLNAGVGLIVMELLLRNALAFEQLCWAEADAVATLLDAATLPPWRTTLRRLGRRARRRLVLLLRVFGYMWRRDWRQARLALLLALRRWPV